MKKPTKRSNAQRRRRKPQVRGPHVPQAPPAPRHRRFLQIAKAIVGTPLAVVAFVYAVWEPPWPTKPTFSPSSPSFGSAIDVPFIVTNKSAWFDLSNLTIECRIMNLLAEGPTGAAVRQAPGIYTTIAARGVNKSLAQTASAPFTCPFRGRIGVDVGDAADQIKRVSVAFASEYDSPFFLGRTTSVSQTFSLDTATMPRRWVPGEPLR